MLRGGHGGTRTHKGMRSKRIGCSIRHCPQDREKEPRLAAALRVFLLTTGQVPAITVDDDEKSENCPEGKRDVDYHVVLVLEPAARGSSRLLMLT